jgi:two-component system response regulator
MSDEIPEILLVEDSTDDVAFFQRTLDQAGLGARLRTLPDGAAALEFIFGPAPQAPLNSLARLKLIILDLKLPKVGGLEVLHRLKAHPQTRTIPVVILSSSQEERDLIECYRLGANSYIVKPMDFDAFGTSVRMLCQYWLQFNQTP